MADAREEMYHALEMAFGEPTSRNARAPYLSVFWEDKHISATIWKEGLASLYLGGTFQEVIDAAHALKSLPLSGFMPDED